MGKLMRNPYIFWPLLLVLLGYTFYMQYESYELPHSAERVFAQDLAKKTLATQSEAVAVTSPQPNSSALEQTVAQVDSPASPMTFTEFREVEDWNKSRGYIDRKDREVYESYSEEALFAMANEGDIYAFDEMASRAIDAGGRREQAFQLYYRAATFGSTAALADMTIFTVPDSANKDEAVRRAAVIETLAILSVGALRGDPRVGIGGVEGYKRRYEHFYGELNLTEEESQKIAARAKEYYDVMLEERHKLGLGDFDNSTPVSVQESYQ